MKQRSIVTMKLALALAILFLFFLHFAGCSSDEEGPDPQLNGHWTGASPANSLDIILAENNGTITGDGEWIRGSTGFDYNVDIEGTLTGNQFEIDILGPGLEGTYTGTVNAERTRMEGILSHDGDNALVLMKQ